jgi:S1-C subfamily serine protease
LLGANRKEEMNECQACKIRNPPGFSIYPPPKQMCLHGDLHHDFFVPVHPEQMGHSLEWMGSSAEETDGDATTADEEALKLALFRKMAHTELDHLSRLGHSEVKIKAFRRALDSNFLKPTTLEATSTDTNNVRIGASLQQNSCEKNMQQPIPPLEREARKKWYDTMLLRHIASSLEECAVQQAKKVSTPTSGTDGVATNIGMPLNDDGVGGGGGVGFTNGKKLVLQETDIELSAFRIAVKSTAKSPLDSQMIMSSSSSTGSGFLIDIRDLLSRLSSCTSRESCRVDSFTAGAATKTTAQSSKNKEGTTTSNREEKEIYPYFVITNGHVIRNANQVELTNEMYPGEIFTAEVAAVCFDLDLAFLRCSNQEQWGSKKFKPFPIASVSRNYIQNIGEAIENDTNYARMTRVYAIGYPLGTENVQITGGNISGWELVSDEPMIQLTAPVNPGSSGGALLNKQGAVIGIVVAGIPSASNVGFAIPVNYLINLSREVWRNEVEVQAARQRMHQQMSPELAQLQKLMGDKITAIIRSNSTFVINIPYFGIHFVNSDKYIQAHPGKMVVSTNASGAFGGTRTGVTGAGDLESLSGKSQFIVSDMKIISSTNSGGTGSSTSTNNVPGTTVTPTTIQDVKPKSPYFDSQSSRVQFFIDIKMEKPSPSPTIATSTGAPKNSLGKDSSVSSTPNTNVQSLQTSSVASQENVKKTVADASKLNITKNQTTTTINSIAGGVFITKIEPLSFLAFPVESADVALPLQTDKNTQGVILPRLMDRLLQFDGYAINAKGYVAEKTYPAKVSLESLFRTLPMGDTFRITFARGEHLYTNVYKFLPRQHEYAVPDKQSGKNFATAATSDVASTSPFIIPEQLALQTLTLDIIDLLKEASPGLVRYREAHARTRERIMVIKDFTESFRITDVISTVNGKELESMQQLRQECVRYANQYITLSTANGKVGLFFVSSAFSFMLLLADPSLKQPDLKTSNSSSEIPTETGALLGSTTTATVTPTTGMNSPSFNNKSS